LITTAWMETTEQALKQGDAAASGPAQRREQQSAALRQALAHIRQQHADFRELRYLADEADDRLTSYLNATSNDPAAPYYEGPAEIFQWLKGAIRPYLVAMAEEE
jgi:ferredoxin-NADP reductase